MRRSLSFIAAAVLAVLAGVLSYRYLAAPKLSETAEAAPELRFNTLDGKAVALKSLHGRWVLVNFWASWCAPCMDEIPHLVQAQADYASLGLQIIGPALDEAEAVKPVLGRFAMNYPVSADFASADAAMRAFGNDRGVLPFTVLIDPDGFIVQRHLGGLSAEALGELLRRHLGH